MGFNIFNSEDFEDNHSQMPPTFAALKCTWNTRWMFFPSTQRSKKAKKGHAKCDQVQLVRLVKTHRAKVKEEQQKGGEDRPGSHKDDEGYRL